MPDEIYEKRKLSTEKKLSSILRFGIFIILLIVSTHIISESIRPPELRDEFNGVCVEKHSFTHDGAEDFGDCIAEFGMDGYTITSIENPKLTTTIELPGETQFSYYW